MDVSKPLSEQTINWIYEQCTMQYPSIVDLPETEAYRNYFYQPSGMEKDILQGTEFWECRFTFLWMILCAEGYE